MTLRFAYERPDGGVSIVTAMPKEALVEIIGTPDEQGVKHISDKAFRQHVIDRSIPEDASNVIELPEDWSPPVDRAFRNAWMLSAGKVTVDMSKARDIHRDHLRTLREPLLKALDIDYQRADEAGDAKAKAAIAKRKQGLRDVTADPAIEAAQASSELAAVIPEALR